MQEKNDAEDLDFREVPDTSDDIGITKRELRYYMAYNIIGLLGIPISIKLGIAENYFGAVYFLGFIAFNLIVAYNAEKEKPIAERSRLYMNGIPMLIIAFIIYLATSVIIPIYDHIIS